eukprot:800413-Rhodomonas_salina.2
MLVLSRRGAATTQYGHVPTVPHTSYTVLTRGYDPTTRLAASRSRRSSCSACAPTWVHPSPTVLCLAYAMFGTEMRCGSGCVPISNAGDFKGTHPPSPLYPPPRNLHHKNLPL